MRKPFLLFLCVVPAALILAGCGTLTTDNTVTTYNAEGKIVSVAKVSGSVIPAIVESTRNKTVIAWDNSWLAGISVSAATTEDPTPTFKLLAGRKDKGVINLLPQHDISVLRGIITAIRSGDLSVSPTGVTSTQQAPSK